VRRALRLLGVALHLAWGYAACTLLYPVIRPPVRRALRRAWARGVFGILGVRLDAAPLAIPPGSLVVANHVSWLDALAIQALLPACVVAKSDTLGWPLLGTMLARNDTLFVERRATRRLLAVNAGIRARLARGERVVVFPEGTTTDGGTLLAFRPALFEPAAVDGFPVHALALAYRDAAGRPGRAAAYIGRMSLWQSLCEIADCRGLALAVSPCGPVAASGCRRELAARARASVYRRLCGSENFIGSRAASGVDGSGSPAGWMPSSAVPTWESSADVSRT
jgi:1-acyl-sn-glycerol-3-phosphate acyltransferase